MSNHTLHASALSSSPVTSRNASTMSACVDTGAANTLDEKKYGTFQYIPSSSERTPRSLIEAMISFASAASPRRFIAIAASACDSSPRSGHSFLRCATNWFSGSLSFEGATPAKECMYIQRMSNPFTRNGILSRFSMSRRSLTSFDTLRSRDSVADAKKSGYATPARWLSRAKPVRM